jgi:hypothetical protein
MHPGRRRVTLWFALLAAALNALSPLAAYARSDATALPMLLCSSTAPAGAGGAAETPAPDAPAGHVSHAPHCGFCPAAGFSFPALPAVGLPAVHPAADAATYFLRALPLVRDSSYLPSRPRGPPALHS